MNESDINSKWNAKFSHVRKDINASYTRKSYTISFHCSGSKFSLKLQVVTKRLRLTLMTEKGTSFELFKNLKSAQKNLDIFDFDETSIEICLKLKKNGSQT